ncbi:hypothetical protein ACLKA7_010769 [Drosophila subpalustris]
MCGTTWNGKRLNRRQSQLPQPVKVKTALPASCSHSATTFTTVIATDLASSSFWLANNNVKYVRRFAIHTQKWMSGAFESQCGGQPVPVPVVATVSTVPCGLWLPRTPYCTQATITHCLCVCGNGKNIKLKCCCRCRLVEKCAWTQWQ